MYNDYKTYPCPYFMNMPMYNTCPCSYCFNTPMYNTNQYMPFNDEMEDADLIELKDYGPKPFVVNINEATKQNNTFRTALWTGEHLQVTLMSINPGEDIGLEIHPHLDQFLRIEEGQGIVKMGNRKDKLDFQRRVSDDFAIMIPAGTWHNIINTGDIPLKLYSIYAPPQHPHGTVHKTKAEAEAAEKEHGH
ncbi:cupin domain-containing protein [Clostridium malenominatum]|uniref:Cupin domain-containing protein n=1 Tax=Clostridium malenominatum TaxID=1539 RepID=A0ABP3UBH5_9CLOT